MNDIQLKTKIRQAIVEFGGRDLRDAALAMFGTLGYQSDRTITVASVDDFCEQFDQEAKLAHPKAMKNSWLMAELLFQLTDEELSTTTSLFKDTSVRASLLQSYVFLAIELKAGDYARGKLAAIARQINRIFPMPVMVLFKVADKLSLAVINRRLNKRDESKDEGYQKIILTHDRGFYQEFKRRIGMTHADWSFQCFKGKPNDALNLVADKTDLQKAEDYLAGHDLEEAAIFLRKSAEAAAMQVREFLEGKKLPAGEFFSLTENLKFSKNKLQEKLPRLLFEKALKGTPKEHRVLLLPASDADLDANSTLDAPSKGMLKGQRKRLRQLFDDEAWANIDTLELLDQLLSITDRVLNPAAHGNEAPLYEDEVEKAVAIVRQFGAIARP